MSEKFDRRSLNALLATTAVACGHQRPWIERMPLPINPMGRKLPYEEPASFPPLRMSMAYPWQPDQGDGTYQNIQRVSIARGTETRASANVCYPADGAE